MDFIQIIIHLIYLYGVFVSLLLFNFINKNYLRFFKLFQFI